MSRKYKEDAEMESYEQSGKTGLSLLKKGQKGMKRAIFSRLGLMLAMLLAQWLG